MKKVVSQKSSVPAGSQLLLGKRAVLEAFTFSPERFLKVMLLQSKESDPEREQLAVSLKQADVPVQFVPREVLVEVAGSEHHQGYVALLKPRTSPDFKGELNKLSKKAQSLVVAIDAIEDPQNLGAILRAAECFAADAVIWSRNRGVGITPAVSKASVGASEIVNWVEVANLVDALKKLKEAEFWVVGAEIGEKAEALFDFKFPAKCVIVLGREGEGLHRLVRENLDFQVAIPQFGRIQSLNVSQAAAIMLCAYRGQVG